MDMPDTFEHDFAVVANMLCDNSTFEEATKKAIEDKKEEK